jgi:hypothetical protein
MPPLDPLVLSFAVALGAGLLIGTERERRKGEGPERAAAGLRTFTLASLAGAISFAAGGVPLFAVAAAGIFSLAALAYWRGEGSDPGLTTEIALVSAVLLGGLAISSPELAAAVAVVVASLSQCENRAAPLCAQCPQRSRNPGRARFRRRYLDRSAAPAKRANWAPCWPQPPPNLDHRHPCDGDRRDWPCRGQACRSPFRPPPRRVRLRIHFRHRDSRRDGSAIRLKPRSFPGGRGRRGFRLFWNHCSARSSAGCRQFCRFEHGRGAAYRERRSRNRLWPCPRAVCIA